MFLRLSLFRGTHFKKEDGASYRIEAPGPLVVGSNKQDNRRDNIDNQ